MSANSARYLHLVVRAVCLSLKVNFSANFVFSRALCHLGLDLWWRIARAICTYLKITYVKFVEMTVQI